MTTQTQSRQSSSAKDVSKAAQQFRQQAFSSIPSEDTSCSVEQLQLGDWVFDPTGACRVARLEQSSYEGKPVVRMELLVEPGTQIESVKRFSYEPTQLSVEQLYQSQSAGQRWLIQDEVDGQSAFWPARIRRDETISDEFILEIDPDQAGQGRSQRHAVSGDEKMKARLARS